MIRIKFTIRFLLLATAVCSVVLSVHLDLDRRIKSLQTAIKHRPSVTLTHKEGTSATFPHLAISDTTTILDLLWFRRRLLVDYDRHSTVANGGIMMESVNRTFVFDILDCSDTSEFGPTVTLWN